MKKKWAKLKEKKKTVGLDRDLNPGPRAPEARIIPLDHQARPVGPSVQVLHQAKMTPSQIGAFVCPHRRSA